MPGPALSRLVLLVRFGFFLVRIRVISSVVGMGIFDAEFQVSYNSVLLFLKFI